MAADKSALNLLKYYDSDENDEENSTDSIESSKRSLEECNNIQSKKLCSNSRLPVPTFLSSSGDKKFVDNPAQHEGKIRSFPHERGNWSSHVYIPCSDDAIEPPEQWRKLVSFLKTWNFADSDTRLKIVDDFHISLSRTVVLRHHWIDSFVSDLREKCASTKGFPLHLAHYRVLLNDEKTRTFLAVPVLHGSHFVATLSSIADKALAEFRLPPFYEEGSFHVSVAWCLGDQKSVLESALESHLETEPLNQLSCVWSINVDQVHCKTGNKVYMLPLAST